LSILYCNNWIRLSFQGRINSPCLLTFAPDRYPQFKDAPTTKESDMGEPISSYRGILGPPDMPGYAVKKLEVTFKKAWDNDRFQKYMGDMLMQPYWLSSSEYGKQLDKMNEQWKVTLGEFGLLKKK
jgi:putative tricarboxylic transport membrane protein